MCDISRCIHLRSLSPSKYSVSSTSIYVRNSEPQSHTLQGPPSTALRDFPVPRSGPNTSHGTLGTFAPFRPAPTATDKTKPSSTSTRDACPCLVNSRRGASGAPPTRSALGTSGCLHTLELTIAQATALQRDQDGVRVWAAAPPGEGLG
ncbi:hypothetical protein BS50DRAFT_392964 [Corynespora cassiicola Philippines]|uniref:Uncharacterized protein n=1 Tax=Corynespora cassiicola Philippines TaxID=1448308 RepID=A0A2T2NQ36_CORCC|nr:hypothetical protein BS50DRAFT_392964 [Corynespora cassiicola Philippines]